MTELPPFPTASRLLRTRLHDALAGAFAADLSMRLNRTPLDRRGAVRPSFDAFITMLTDYCLRAYPAPGTLSVPFLQGLHRAFFPPGYHRRATLSAGETLSAVPGAFTGHDTVAASVLHRGKVRQFTPPAQVPAAMEAVVVGLNTALAGGLSRRETSDAILLFICDFMSIHPFPDLNGRISTVVGDLSAVHAGLPPFSLLAIQVKAPQEFARATEVTQEERSLHAMHDLLASHGWRLDPPPGRAGISDLRHSQSSDRNGITGAGPRRV